MYLHSFKSKQVKKREGGKFKCIMIDTFWDMGKPHFHKTSE